MNKKATIRDVAREAGVSVATVSYVLNNRSDQKISSETKRKVLQIANLLQYTPSYAAKFLTTGKSNIIGIQLGEYAIRNTENYDFISKLIAGLAAHGYNAMLLPVVSNEKIEPLQNIDGIICIDLPRREFDWLSENYLIPIVCIDMIVDHYLFFQIYNDYSLLKDRFSEYAEYTVIMEKPQNEKYADYVQECFQNRLRFCTDMDSLKAAIAECPPPYVTIGDYLSLCSVVFTSGAKIIPISSSLTDFPIARFHTIELQTKVEKTVSAMFDAMARNPVSHDIKILI